MTEPSDSTEGCRDNCGRNFKSEFEIAELGGELVYRALAVFKSWKDCLSARKYLSKATGKMPSGKSAGYLFLNDPIHQHLLVTGQTCFRGMTPSDLNHLQIDIETYCSPGFEFPNPEREEDRLIAIALSDSSGWETVLWGKELTEPEICCKLASQWDAAHPDENVAYYKAKLEELYGKFKVYLLNPEPPAQGVLKLE